MTKTFIKICKMSQKSLKTYVTSRLRNTHKDITVADGFVYAQGTFPVLLVAHLDTVHKDLPTQIFYDANRGDITSPQGIGGDDRCGVYMIFEVLKKFNCSVLFCEDEETGGVGARKFTKSDLAKNLEFNYIIEFDRKGDNDAVFYDCDNEDFEKFITQDFYKTAFGSFSDISVIAPVLKCAAVNLSCGYYNAHFKTEYVNVQEMEESIKAACEILGRTTDEDKFEYIEAVRNYSRGNWSGYGGWSGYGVSNFDWKSYYAQKYGYVDEFSEGDEYDDCYSNVADTITMGDNYYLIEYVNDLGRAAYQEVYANSYAEAAGKFLMLFANITYNDIISISCDDKFCV